MEALNIFSYEFAYPRSESVLKNIDLQLEAGSFTLLVGATGSGKTTLLRCIKPELSPAGEKRGSISIFGKPLDSLTSLESAQYIGYVSQDPDNQIVCDTVWHEIAFGLENIGMKPNAMRRRVAEIAHFFGMEPWVHEETSKLSGGQKQLVTLASALALQPKILLLDEPTAQLDPVAEKNFLHALFRINRELETTVIVATHAPYSMRNYATDTITLHEGTVAERSISVSPASSQRYISPVLAAEGPKEMYQDSAAVSLTDIHFAYERKGRSVLRDLSLSIKKNNIHALVGGNGCGKSTLLRIIAGALRPQHGKVSNAFGDRQVLLPQNPKALFVCDTINEELIEWKSSNGYTEDDIDEVVKQYGLEKLLDKHPYDISGGEQQLVAFAKLMLNRPELLLLDEPTKGLDCTSREKIVTTLMRLKREGKTIIIATHDLSFAQQVAESIALIFDGEVACSEPADQFFENNLFYRPEAPTIRPRYLSPHENPS